MASMLLPTDRAPWDGSVVFLPPVTKLVTVPGSAGPAVKLAAADPTRWMIAIGIAGTSNVSFYTTPGVPPQAGVGILVAATLPTLIFMWPQYGGMVTGEWYAEAGQVGGGQASVITQSVSSWPVGDAVDMIGDLMRAAYRPPPPSLPSAPNVGGRMSVTSYWRNLMAALAGRRNGG